MAQRPGAGQSKGDSSGEKFPFFAGRETAFKPRKRDYNDDNLMTIEFVEQNNVGDLLAKQKEIDVPVSYGSKPGKANGRFRVESYAKDLLNNWTAVAIVDLDGPGGARWGGSRDTVEEVLKWASGPRCNVPVFQRRCG